MPDDCKRGIQKRLLMAGIGIVSLSVLLISIEVGGWMGVGQMPVFLSDLILIGAASAIFALALATYSTLCRKMGLDRALHSRETTSTSIEAGMASIKDASPP